MSIETAYALFCALIEQGFCVSMSGGPPARHPSAPKGAAEGPWCGLEVRGENLEYTKQDLMTVNDLCKQYGVDWVVRINEGISIR